MTLAPEIAAFLKKSHGEDQEKSTDLWIYIDFDFIDKETGRRALFGGWYDSKEITAYVPILKNFYPDFYKTSFGYVTEYRFDATDFCKKIKQNRHVQFSKEKVIK